MTELASSEPINASAETLTEQTDAKGLNINPCGDSLIQWNGTKIQVTVPVGWQAWVIVRFDGAIVNKAIDLAGNCLFAGARLGWYSCPGTNHLNSGVDDSIRTDPNFALPGWLTIAPTMSTTLCPERPDSVPAVACDFQRCTNTIKIVNFRGELASEAIAITVVLQDNTFGN